ncbi:hypothetical protein HanXRQr2_Chr04g0177151 [Helianthus annuus]|nr:hypothetical protein HanXRQr2_Chr04g0177151 [Helianthus annuus]KAJ0932198.1 hypothetical protein HanPSC8_Chr04g0170911 [Helianthus annuus]
MQPRRRSEPNGNVTGDARSSQTGTHSTRYRIIVSFVLLEFFSIFTRALFQGIQTQPM